MKLLDIKGSLSGKGMNENVQVPKKSMKGLLRLYFITWQIKCLLPHATYKKIQMNYLWEKLVQKHFLQLWVINKAGIPKCTKKKRWTYFTNELPRIFGGKEYQTSIAITFPNVSSIMTYTIYARPICHCVAHKNHRRKSIAYTNTYVHIQSRK